MPQYTETVKETNQSKSTWQQSRLSWTLAGGRWDRTWYLWVLELVDVSQFEIGSRWSWPKVSKTVLHYSMSTINQCHLVSVWNQDQARKPYQLRKSRQKKWVQMLLLTVDCSTKRLVRRTIRRDCLRNQDLTRTHTRVWHSKVRKDGLGKVFRLCTIRPDSDQYLHFQPLIFDLDQPDLWLIAYLVHLFIFGLLVQP